MPKWDITNSRGKVLEAISSFRPPSRADGLRILVSLGGYILRPANVYEGADSTAGSQG